MKVLGVDISGREVRIVALDNGGDTIVNSTGTYKPLRLNGDENAATLKLFKNTLFATFDGFGPDVIVYNARNSTGKFAGSAISFKIESLIQLYENAEIVSTKSQTIAAFYKKNELPIACEYGYQEDALKLAYHYLEVD
ncbi:MAG: DUF3010 family protein [Pyrinomonadaceae bacterium]